MSFLGLRRRNDVPRPPVQPLLLGGICSHGNHRHETTRLRRIGGLGLVPICDPCVARLQPLYSHQLDADPVIRRHERPTSSAAQGFASAGTRAWGAGQLRQPVDSVPGREDPLPGGRAERR